MALLKINCPECRAGLKSPTGFKAGQKVRCPKCETYFAVEEPDEADETEEPAQTRPAPGKKPVKVAEYDEDEDVAPKNKKKKRRDDDDEDDGRSYKNSPLRYAILGVLVVVMLVLGYMLYDKRVNNREADGPALASSDTAVAPANPLPPPKTGPAGVQLRPNPPLPGGPAGVPGGPAGPAGGNPLGGLLGGGPLPAAEASALKQKLQAQLLGTWTADLGDGYREEITYAADGTYTAKLTGATPATAGGKYTVLQAVGSKGLKVQIGGKTVTVSFDDDTIEQPSLRPGFTGTYRRK